MSAATTPMPEVAPEFYILRAKDPNGFLLLWWRPNRSGYTHQLEEAGRYSEAEAMKLHRPDCGVIALPCASVDKVSRRTVHDTSFRGLLVAAHVCLIEGCPDRTEGGAEHCAACLKGVAEGALTHAMHAEKGHRTWCDEPLLHGRGTRTARTRESMTCAAAATCGTCKARAKAYQDARDLVHLSNCESPYCDGCVDGGPHDHV